MAIKKSNTRISVILTYDEWEYLDFESGQQFVSKSKYLEELLQKDMAERDKSDDPEYIIKEIKVLLNQLQSKSKEMEVKMPEITYL